MIKTSAAARVLSANIGSPRKQVNSGSSARLSLLATDIQSVHELARAEEPALKLKLATV